MLLWLASTDTEAIIALSVTRQAPSAPNEEVNSLTDDDIARDLSARLEPPLLVIAVGTELRGDDAFGPATAALLKASRLPEGVLVLDGGVAPENLAERAARERPGTVLIVDAADFGGSVAELRLIGPDDLGWGLPGTHAPSLGLLASYLASRCGARTILLAAQPGDVDFGKPMSAEMREATRRASQAIRRAAEGTTIDD